MDNMGNGRPRIKSENELSKMTVSDYVDYYEKVLIDYDKGELTLEEISPILDDFSARAYNIIVYLMGCCNICDITFKSITDNLFAMVLELNSKNVSGNTDNVKKIIEDVKDLCIISRNGLKGSFRKNGEEFLRSIELDVEEIESINEEAIKDYLKEVTYDIDDMDEDIGNADIEDENISNEDMEECYVRETKELNSYDDTVLHFGNSDTNQNFYCRIIDQENGIDREFKSVEDLKRFVNRY